LPRASVRRRKQGRWSKGAEEQLAKDVEASTPSCTTDCDALWQAAKEWAASKRAGNLFIEPNQIRVNTNIVGNLMALTINRVTENGVTYLKTESECGMLASWCGNSALQLRLDFNKAMAESVSKPANSLLDLTDDELAAAAMAARGAAALAKKDAERQTTLSTRAAFEDSERRYRDLAEKFERARSWPSR
jgi:hypothetical protein